MGGRQSSAPDQPGNARHHRSENAGKRIEAGFRRCGGGRLEADPVKRWVPLLGAYAGARLSEICQLRAEDIALLSGIWCMKFAPEAGSLKTAGSKRVVPLHPTVIEAGFLQFVAKSAAGPLFPSLPPAIFGTRGGNGTKIIGRWVRGLGLTDARISPSHPRRHRFKRPGRRHGLMPDIVNARTGHHRKTVADSYGELARTGDIAHDLHAARR
jgi:integrase